MKLSIKKGLGFGLTSGIITTLGLMVGLNSGTHSRLVVLGGILSIAIADALSDALGIHISEESTNKKPKNKSIWESTASTFFFKFIFALSFVIPVLLFNLQLAIIISVIWGMFLLTIFSLHIAKRNKTKPLKVVAEHLIIAGVVVIVTHFVGVFVSKVFV